MVATHAMRIPSHLVPISSTVILRTNHQAPSLLRPPICCLNNIDLLLLVLNDKILLIVVSRSKVNHDVLIPVEEHNRHGVVDLVHLVEVLDLIDVADIDHGEVLDAVGDFVEDFILEHAVWVVVTAEADEN